MAALRFGLKELAHPAVGGTPLLNRIGALPLNVSYILETAFTWGSLQMGKNHNFLYITKNIFLSQMISLIKKNID